MVKKQPFIDNFTRYSALKLSVVVIIVYVGIGLLNMQVFNYSYYSESAKSGSHRFVEVQAPRGNICDTWRDTTMILKNRAKKNNMEIRDELHAKIHKSLNR